MHHARRSARTGIAEMIRDETGLPIYRMTTPALGSVLAAVDGSRTTRFEFVDALSIHCEG